MARVKLRYVRCGDCGERFRTNDHWATRCPAHAAASLRQKPAAGREDWKPDTGALSLASRAEAINDDDQASALAAIRDALAVPARQ